MERIYTATIKKQLSTRIRGRISVHIINNILIVDIDTDQYNCFRCAINNIALNGYISISTRAMIDVIIKQYRKHVLQKYFY